MAETTYTWATVPVTELCMNHFGSRLRFRQGGVSLEGTLFGLLLFGKNDHRHAQIGIDTDDGEMAQVDLSSDASVELSLEKVQ